MKLLSSKLLPGAAHPHSMEGGGVTASDTNLSTSLVTFPSLLVASLGGLLHNRLLERLEGHMEDAHCSESAMKTQATRKIPMLGHREYCRMRPPVHVISPWFVLPLLLLLCLFVLHMVSCTQALLLFLSLSSWAHTTHCSPCCPASQPSEEEQAALGGSSWLAEIPGLQGFLLDLRGVTSTAQPTPGPAHPPTLAAVFL